MKIISKLEMWLEYNYYSFNRKIIGKHRIYEIYII